MDDFVLYKSIIVHKDSELKKFLTQIRKQKRFGFYPTVELAEIKEVNGNQVQHYKISCYGPNTKKFGPIAKIDKLTMKKLKEEAFSFTKELK